MNERDFYLSMTLLGFVVVTGLCASLGFLVLWGSSILLEKFTAWFKKLRGNNGNHKH